MTFSLVLELSTTLLQLIKWFPDVMHVMYVMYASYVAAEKKIKRKTTFACETDGWSTGIFSVLIVRHQNSMKMYYL